MKKGYLFLLSLIITFSFSGCRNKDFNHSSLIETTIDKNCQSSSTQEINQLPDTINHPKSNLSLIIETLKTLSSDDYKGRLTGTEGNQKTIDFLVNRYKAIGLNPFKDNSYYHTYKQAVFNPDEVKHSLVVIFEDNTQKEYLYGKDYIDRFRIKELELQAPATMNILDDGLFEKIVIIDDHEFSNEIFEGSNLLFVKTSGSFFGTATIKDDGKPFIQITEKMYDELKSRKVKNISIKIKYDVKEITAKNVVGKIEGTDPTKALVISAHFDHVGWAQNTIFYGAIDNASGTTVMLDIAERLKKYSDNHKFNMDILIVGFNGEESGLNGSKAFVNDIKDKYKSIYNINFDCIGKKNGGDISLGQNTVLNNDLIKIVKENLAKDKVKFTDKYYGKSDHLSFNDNNLVGISIGQENLFGREDRFSIHTPDDTIEAVDYNELKKISDAIYDFVISNDGEVFNSNELSASQSGDNSTDEVISKAEELAKELNLAYDELFRTSIDEYQVQITGNKFLKGMDLLEKYYPKLIIPQDIQGYKYYGVKIHTKDGLIKTFSQNNNPFNVDELGKVIKRNLSLDNITGLSLEYKKENTRLLMEIDKQEENFKKDYFFSLHDTEKIKIDGVEYFLGKHIHSKTMKSIYKKFDIDNSSYDIIISLDDHNSSNLREKLTELVKKIHIEQLINSSGI